MAEVKVSADPPKTKPNGTLVACVYVGLIIVVAIAAAIDANTNDFGARVKTDFTLFAVFFILASAIERVLEPIARLWTVEPADPANLTDAEKTKAAERRANKEVLFWGLATGVAAVMCGYFGLRLLESVVELPKGSTGTFRFLDLAITALAIGAGTKSLHDLIDRVQRPKQATTEAAGGA